MTDPAPVQLLLTGSCDNIGESWLLDYLTGYRFPHDEVEIVCEQQAPEMILTASSPRCLCRSRGGGSCWQGWQ
jgi:hypothetical protein